MDTNQPNPQENSNPGNQSNPVSNNSNQASPQNTENKQLQKKGQDNTVFIGSKKLMNYVNSISMQFKTSPEVKVKARGKFISKAVDIVEVAKRQDENKGIKMSNISIGTEEYTSEGKQIKVSTIDITLAK